MDVSLPFCVHVCVASFEILPFRLFPPRTIIWPCRFLSFVTFLGCGWHEQRPQFYLCQEKQLERISPKLVAFEILDLQMPFCLKRSQIFGVFAFCVHTNMTEKRLVQFAFIAYSREVYFFFLSKKARGCDDTSFMSQLESKSVCELGVR